MKIVIGSDIAVTGSHEQFFESGEIDRVIDKEIINILNNADYRIYNLETPLCKRGEPIKKAGPNLIASEKSIRLIKKLNPNLLLLANNHILDFGYDGLRSTLNILNENNINSTGIVSNIKEEYEGYIIKNNDLKIGIYNLCENEFSVATKYKMGSNSLNLLKNCSEIKKLRSKVNFLIVIFHGGKEFYRYPSPMLQENCRTFIEYGADLVITQHSHCIGCEEIYKNKRILYGQGNFIFDRKNDEYWNTELLIEIEFNKAINIKYYPIEKHDSKYYISKNEKILSDFYERSRQIMNEGFIQQKYKEFANKNLNLYLSMIHKNNILEKFLNKFLKRRYILNKYSTDTCLSIINIIECEAHKELFLNGLKEKVYGKK